MRGRDRPMGWHATWAMAVGGMIGGGIYTLAGVVLALSGPWAWLSLIVGGVVAVVTACSYASLARTSGEAGVPITLLAAEGHEHLAGILAWVLLVLYVVTTAVYAFTFGHYVVAAFGAAPALASVMEVAVVAIFVALNVSGVREPVRVQIVAVWIELAVLVALAVFGFLRWNPNNLVEGVPGASATGVLLGAAVTFVAFEGFEMLTYDTAEIRSPARTLRSALPLAVVAVAAAYALVTVGAASLVGAQHLVDHKEAALAYAARHAMGLPGLVIVTCAAAASAASAINATLFSASRLFRSCARRGLLPHALEASNARHSPVLAIVLLGGLSALAATAATLDALVQTASLSFLLLFGAVNMLAFQRLHRRRALAALAALAAAGLAAIVAVNLARREPVALLVLAVALAVAVLCHFLMPTHDAARASRRAASSRR